RAARTGPHPLLVCCSTGVFHREDEARVDAIERLSLLAEALRARLRGLHVLISESPTAEFREAVERLVPAGDELERVVHLTLAEPTSASKRNVLVLHRGEPVLATTLRARQGRWEIATAGVAPAARIPHRTGFLESALSALRLPILIQD